MALVLVASAWAWWYKGELGKLEAAGKALGGDLFSDGVRGTRDGIPWELLHVRGGNGRPARVLLRLASPHAEGFQIRVQTGVDAIAQHAGLSVEVQTGDRAFDDAFYLVTDGPRPLLELLSDPLRRDAVRGLFEDDCASVQNDGALVATWQGPGAVREMTPARIDAAFRNLARLCLARENAPNARPLVPTPLRSDLRFRPAVLLGMVGMTAVIWLGLSTWFAYPPIDALGLLLHSLRVSQPTLLAFLACVAWAVRGRSTSHRTLGRVACFAAAAFTWCGFVWEMHRNGSADRGPAALHVVAVVDTYGFRWRGNPTCHLVVESWLPDRETIDLDAPMDVCKEPDPTIRRACVITRPGHLGFPWVVRVWLQ